MLEAEDIMKIDKTQYLRRNAEKSKVKTFSKSRAFEKIDDDFKGNWLHREN